MQYILTRHAQIQSVQRNVSEEEIIFTLRNFHITVPGNNGGTGLFAHMPNGDTVILWIVGELPLIEPVIIKTTVKRGK
jgi:hypothetical protein